MNRIDNSECLHEFGRYIREAREKRKLNQTDVAQVLGITQAYYSMIERGERDVDLVLAMKICSVLRLNMKKFIGTYL